MTKEQLRELGRWLGRRSYRARLKRLGLKRIQQIARENGKRGGRPKDRGSQVATRGER